VQVLHDVQVQLVVKCLAFHLQETSASVKQTIKNESKVNNEKMSYTTNANECYHQTQEKEQCYQDVAWHIPTTGVEQALDHLASCRHAMLHCHSSVAVLLHQSLMSSQSVHLLQSSLAVVASLMLVITAMSNIKITAYILLLNTILVLLNFLSNSTV